MASEGGVSVLAGPEKPLDCKTIIQLFEEQLKDEEKLEATAVIFQERKTSYRELNDTANRISRHITNEILKKKMQRNSDGDFIIAVCMAPTDRLLVTLLAVWKTGAAYLPIDTSFPQQRIHHILAESKAIMVIYGSKDSERAIDFGGVVSTSFDELFEISRSELSQNICNKDRFRQATPNLAIVLYTSGSTGVPKGVRLPHSVLRNRIEWQLREFPFGVDEKVCVMKTALTFVDSVCEIWAPLINGLSLVVVPKHVTVDPEKLTRLLEEYKVQRLVLVPTLLRSLLLYLSLKDDKHQLHHLKLWISSGEPLPVNLAEEFFQQFSFDHVLCNFYGSTEVMGDVTYHVISNAEELARYEKIPIGLPLDNTIIYLLDEDMEPVKNGIRGELWISGLNLADGYVNGRDPDRFIRNPHQKCYAYSRLYRTGDFAKVVNGVIYYEGRSDSQVKIRGHRIDLAEVEKVLTTIQDVDKGVVLCYKPGEVEQALLAFVTSKHNPQLTGLYLERLLQDKLPSYMMPQVTILDDIPLLVNGKVDRQSLLKMYETTNNNDDTSLSLDIDYTGVSIDKMSVAEDLFAIVGSVIGRSARAALTVNSNFYDLGGNSLNSIFTITRLRERGYKIGITDFIMAKNLGEVLDIISPRSISIGAEGKDTGKADGGQYEDFVAEPLQECHKDAVIKMIVSSFFEKADLEQWMRPEIRETDYVDLLVGCWEALLAANLSFVVKSGGTAVVPHNAPDALVGVALNLDARDEPELVLDNSLAYIFEFLEYLEGPIRDEQLPAGRCQILHSLMMATEQSMSPADNVAVIAFMERHTELVAEEKRYAGIFTTNTSPLTQQLAIDVLGYQVLLNYQVNQYVSHDSRRLFGMAPDDQRAIVCWKPITF